MREKVYEKLSRAQESAEAKNYAKAFDLLEDVEKMRDLDDYEKAQLYTAYGYIFFTQEKYAESINAYEKVLVQKDLPEALQATTLYTLGQLQFQEENYKATIDYLERWLASATNPGPEPFVFLGQAHYQLGQYRESVEPLERAITTAREREQPVQESWYLLLRASYHELGDYPKLLEILEILVATFPSKEYWIHLAAAYGEMGDEDRQLAAYEIAYEQGYLERGQELLLLSQLLLQAEMPYRAGVVLAGGLEAGLVAGTVEDYRLLSQAWILAHEDAKAIEALTRAADLSDDGELDARLAQAYANLNDWEKTLETARSALRKGVKDAHELEIMSGMALFELGRYDEAKSVFRAVRQSPDGRETASQWLSYIEREQERLRELQRSLE
jgi:tetratricopeptide (TPR) repeat protein